MGIMNGSRGHAVTPRGATELDGLQLCSETIEEKHPQNGSYERHTLSTVN